MKEFHFQIRVDSGTIYCMYQNHYVSVCVTVFDKYGNVIVAIANNQLRLPDNVSKRNLALMLRRMFKRSIAMFPAKKQKELLEEFGLKLCVHIVEE